MLWELTPGTFWRWDAGDLLFANSLAVLRLQGPAVHAAKCLLAFGSETHVLADTHETEQVIEALLSDGMIQQACGDRSRSTLTAYLGFVLVGSPRA
jgi:hypothetical protein